MPTPFIMPKMDMDQESVHIIEWLKEEGDTVDKGDPVVTIETDKITSDVEAPASGTLAGILYGENVDVPVTEVIAYILGEGETEADLPQEIKTEVEESSTQQTNTLTTEKAEKPATAVAKKMAELEGLDLNQIPSTGNKITKKDVQIFLDELKSVEPRVEIPATPAARRIADEKGIDISRVTGSGPRGRIQAVDVEAVRGQQPHSAIPAQGPLVGETLDLSKMRQRIADRMTASYQTIPHIYLTVEVDMSEAEASRRRMNELAAKDGTPEISITAYLIRMVAWSLKRHPYLNASLEDNAIKFWQEINIGVATALESGLIVPVIHNADQQTARELNERLRDLTQRARNGELTHEDIQDGTFTISNLGMYGIQSFTAIINPPQSAILAVGSLTRKPVVTDEDNNLEVRPVMMLTLAADHRIVDGAVAAEFLSDLVKALETPELLLF